MYRTVDCSTWDDPWFADLAPTSKLLFLYLFTNRRVSQCGAMEITVRQAAFETGIPVAEIPSSIDALGDRIQWWPESNLLIVRNFYRHQRAKTGDKFDVAARKSAESLPDFAKQWLYGVYPHLAPQGYTHPIPTPVAPDTHAISVTVAVTEAEAENEKPPTVEARQAGAKSIPPQNSKPNRADKPRTQAQIDAGRLYERRMAVFTAYLRGLNIAPDSLPAEQRKSASLKTLTTPILDTSECVPEIVEPLTRYVAAAFTWRQGRRTPSLAEVLAALPEWLEAGRPDQPPPASVKKLDWNDHRRFKEGVGTGIIG